MSNNKHFLRHWFVWLDLMLLVVEDCCRHLHHFHTSLLKTLFSSMRDKYLPMEIPQWHMPMHIVQWRPFNQWVYIYICNHDKKHIRWQVHNVNKCIDRKVEQTVGGKTIFRGVLKFPSSLEEMWLDLRIYSPLTKAMTNVDQFEMANLQGGALCWGHLDAYPSVSISY